MEPEKQEKQRFWWSVLSLANVLLAIIIVLLGHFVASRRPLELPVKPGVEAQMKQGIGDSDLRKLTLDLAERLDTSSERLHRALFNQKLAAWFIAALLVGNACALTVFFRRMRNSQKRADAAVEHAKAPPEPPDIAPVYPAGPDVPPGSSGSGAGTI